MKVVEGSLEVSFRVLLSEMSKVVFLSILGIWDLNNHIWAFKPEKLFLGKPCLRIMLWKWLKARWKSLLEFFLNWKRKKNLLILGIWDLNSHIWAFRPEKLFLCKSWLRIMLWKWLRARLKCLLELFFLK